VVFKRKQGLEGTLLALIRYMPRRPIKELLLLLLAPFLFFLSSTSLYASKENLGGLLQDPNCEQAFQGNSEGDQTKGQAEQSGHAKSGDSADGKEPKSEQGNEENKDKEDPLSPSTPEAFQKALDNGDYDDSKKISLDSVKCPKAREQIEARRAQQQAQKSPPSKSGPETKAPAEQSFPKNETSPASKENSSPSDSTSKTDTPAPQHGGSAASAKPPEESFPLKDGKLGQDFVQAVNKFGGKFTPEGRLEESTILDLAQKLDFGDAPDKDAREAAKILRSYSKDFFDAMKSGNILPIDKSAVKLDPGSNKLKVISPEELATLRKNAELFDSVQEKLGKFTVENGQFQLPQGQKTLDLTKLSPEELKFLGWDSLRSEKGNVSLNENQILVPSGDGVFRILNREEFTAELTQKYERDLETKIGKIKEGGIEFAKNGSYTIPPEKQEAVLTSLQDPKSELRAQLEEIQPGLADSVLSQGLKAKAYNAISSPAALSEPAIPAPVPPVPGPDGKIDPEEQKRFEILNAQFQAREKALKDTREAAGVRSLYKVNEDDSLPRMGEMARKKALERLVETKQKAKESSPEWVATSLKAAEAGIESPYAPSGMKEALSVVAGANKILERADGSNPQAELQAREAKAIALDYLAKGFGMAPKGLVRFENTKISGASPFGGLEAASVKAGLDYNKQFYEINGRPGDASTDLTKENKFQIFTDTKSLSTRDFQDLIRRREMLFQDAVKLLNEAAPDYLTMGGFLGVGNSAANYTFGRDKEVASRYEAAVRNLHKTVSDLAVLAYKDPRFDKLLESHQTMERQLSASLEERREEVFNELNKTVIKRGVSGAFTVATMGLGSALSGFKAVTSINAAGKPVEVLMATGRLAVPIANVSKASLATGGAMGGTAGGASYFVEKLALKYIDGENVKHSLGEFGQSVGMGTLMGMGSVILPNLVGDGLGSIMSYRSASVAVDAAQSGKWGLAVSEGFNSVALPLAMSKAAKGLSGERITAEQKQQLMGGFGLKDGFTQKDLTAAHAKALDAVKAAGDNPEQIQAINNAYEALSVSTPSILSKVQDAFSSFLGKSEPPTPVAARTIQNETNPILTPPDQVKAPAAEGLGTRKDPSPNLIDSVRNHAQELRNDRAIDNNPLLTPPDQVKVPTTEPSILPRNMDQKTYENLISSVKKYGKVLLEWVKPIPEGEEKFARVMEKPRAPVIDRTQNGTRTTVGPPLIPARQKVSSNNQPSPILSQPDVQRFRNEIAKRVSSETTKLADAALAVAAAQREKSSPSALAKLSSSELLNISRDPDFTTRENIEQVMDRTRTAAAKQGDLGAILSVAPLATKRGSESETNQALVDSALKPFLAAFPANKRTDVGKALVSLSAKAQNPKTDPKFFRSTKALAGLGDNLKWLSSGSPEQRQFGENVLSTLKDIREYEATLTPGLTDRIGGNQVIPDGNSKFGDARALVIIDGTPVSIKLPITEVGRTNISSRKIQAGPDGTELKYTMDSMTPAIANATGWAILRDAQEYSNLTDQRARPTLVLERLGATQEVLAALPKNLEVELVDTTIRSSPIERFRFERGQALNRTQADFWFNRMERALPSIGTATPKDLQNKDAFRVVTIQPGEALVTKGDPANIVYVIPSGAEGRFIVDGQVLPDSIPFYGSTGVLRKGQRNATVRNTSDKPIEVLAIKDDFYAPNISTPKTLAELALENRDIVLGGRLPKEAQSALNSMAEDAVRKLVPENRNAPIESKLGIDSLVKLAIADIRERFPQRNFSPEQEAYLRSRIDSELQRQMTPKELAQTEPILRDPSIEKYINSEAERVAKKAPAIERDQVRQSEIQAGWEMVSEIRRLPGVESLEAVFQKARDLTANSRQGEESTLSRRRDTLALGRRFETTTNKPLQAGDMIQSKNGKAPIYVDESAVDKLQAAGARLAENWKTENRKRPDISDISEFVAKARDEVLRLPEFNDDGGRRAQTGTLSKALYESKALGGTEKEVAVSLMLKGAGLDARYAVIDTAGKQKPSVFVRLRDRTFVSSETANVQGSLHDLRSKITLSQNREISTLLENSPESRSLAAVIAAQEPYRKAKENKAPHLAFLEWLGFRFGEQTNQIETVPLEKVVQLMDQNIERLKDEGKITENDAIRAVRVFSKGGGKNTEFIPVRFGEEPPAGATPVTGIVDFKASLKMLADGYFVLGEHTALGPRHAEHMGTVALHDLAHHSLWHQNPELMRETREAARRLVADGSFYKRLPNIREFQFTPEHMRLMREANVLPSDLRAKFWGMSDAEAARALNESPTSTRWDTVGTLIDSRVIADPPDILKPLNERAQSGLRWTYWLENAFQIPMQKSKELFSQWTEQGWAPTRANGDWETSRTNYAETLDHLNKKNLTADQTASRLKSVLDAFWKTEEPIGGMPRDIFQERQRRDQDPQGFGYYSTPRYMASQAEALLSRYADTKNPALRAELADSIAKLQVVLLEGGRFTAVDWLRDATQKTFDPNTEVARFFRDTGVFSRDLYNSVHGGDIVTPSTPKLNTPAAKAEALAARPDLKGAGNVAEIGAGMKVAEMLGDVAAKNIQPYKMAASDPRYGPLGENGRDGNPQDYASEKRNRQQLDVEFDEMEVNSAGIKFAVGVAAETNRGEGHAWVGVKAVLTPGGEPVTIQAHLRLNSERVIEQQEQIAAVATNLVHMLYADAKKSTIDTSRLLEGTQNTSIDYVATSRGNRPAQPSTLDAIKLVQSGMAPGVVIQGGKPVAPRDAFVPREKSALPPKASDVDTFVLPRESSPTKETQAALEKAIAKSNEQNRPLLVVADNKPTQEFINELNRPNPKPRVSREETAAKAQGPKPDVESKAKALNSELNSVFSLVHRGDTSTAPVTEIFNARSVSNLFEASAQNKPATEAELAKLVDQRLSQITSNRPKYAKVAAGTSSERLPDGVQGTILIKGQRTEGGPIETVKIDYKFSGDAKATAQKARALAVNAMYDFSQPGKASSPLLDTIAVRSTDEISYNGKNLLPESSSKDVSPLEVDKARNVFSRHGQELTPDLVRELDKIHQLFPENKVGTYTPDQIQKKYNATMEILLKQPEFKGKDGEAKAAKIAKELIAGEILGNKGVSTMLSPDNVARALASDPEAVAIAKNFAGPQETGLIARAVAWADQSIEKFLLRDLLPETVRKNVPLGTKLPAMTDAEVGRAYQRTLAEEAKFKKVAEEAAAKGDELTVKEATRQGADIKVERDFLDKFQELQKNSPPGKYELVAFRQKVLDPKTGLELTDLDAQIRVNGRNGQYRDMIVEIKNFADGRGFTKKQMDQRMYDPTVNPDSQNTRVIGYNPNLATKAIIDPNNPTRNRMDPNSEKAATLQSNLGTYVTGDFQQVRNLLDADLAEAQRAIKTEPATPKKPVAEIAKEIIPEVKSGKMTAEQAIEKLVGEEGVPVFRGLAVERKSLETLGPRGILQQPFKSYPFDHWTLDPTISERSAKGPYLVTNGSMKGTMGKSEDTAHIVIEAQAMRGDVDPKEMYNVITGTAVTKGEGVDTYFARELEIPVKKESYGSPTGKLKITGIRYKDPQTGQWLKFSSPSELNKHLSLEQSSKVSPLKRDEAAAVFRNEGQELTPAVEAQLNKVHQMHPEGRVGEFTPQQVQDKYNAAKQFLLEQKFYKDGKELVGKAKDELVTRITKKLIGEGILGNDPNGAASRAKVEHAMTYGDSDQVQARMDLLQNREVLAFQSPFAGQAWTAVLRDPKTGDVKMHKGPRPPPVIVNGMIQADARPAPRRESGTVIVREPEARVKNNFDKEVAIATEVYQKAPDLTVETKANAKTGLIEMQVSREMDLRVFGQRIFPKLTDAGKDQFMETLAVDLVTKVHRLHNEVGVVHSDMKGSNTLVRPYGSAKLIDFGISQKISDLPAIHALYNGGEYSGTPGFKGNGAKVGKPGPSDDFQALGYIFKELLFGDPQSTKNLGDTPFFRARPELTELFGLFADGVPTDAPTGALSYAEMVPLAVKKDLTPEEQARLRDSYRLWNLRRPIQEPNPLPLEERMAAEKGGTRLAQPTGVSSFFDSARRQAQELSEWVFGSGRP
jgi:hypothetical protein